MKIKLKILMSLVLAFVATSLVSNTVFIAGTPYVNQPFIAELRNSPVVFAKRTSDYVASMRNGRQGVEKYQQERVQEYVAQNQSQQSSTVTNPLTPTQAPQSPLPPPTRQEDFIAQGYSETAKDVYHKNDESSKTLYIHIGADAKFEKRMIDIDGQQVEAWIPL